MVRFTDNNSVAIITGAADGMGLEMAVQLSRLGCDLALVDISIDRLNGAQVKCHEAAESSKEGTSLVVSMHVCDVSDEAAVNDLVRGVTSSHKTGGRNLLLFNNAGIGGAASLVTSPKAEFDKVMNIDWGGVLNCTRAFLPLMLAAPAAHVVNTSSVCGMFAQLGYLKPNVSYSAAKFAVRGFTLSLLADFRLNAPHIKATVVCPGWVGTALTSSSQKMFNPSGDAKANIAKMRQSNLVMRNRVADLKKNQDPVTLKLDEAGLLQKWEVDLTQFTDEQLLDMTSMFHSEFQRSAVTTATRAAEIILDGVAKDEWQILVGEDAHALAELLRNNERAVHEDENIIPDLFAFGEWEMNRKRSKL